jgi:16S rRNA (cytidine1402-2'-O)-methyltransferase
MGTVYLIPTVLADGATQCLPAYILDAIKACSVFFVEDERTARRHLKSMWREMVIDDQEWFNMKKVTDETANAFRQRLRDGKNIAVISEAGCPGVADPGQKLAALAQEMNATVTPLVGPNSILLALMASGLNGQQFQFVGYIPINAQERMTTIKALEAESKVKNCTQIFIETPYRNNQLLETLTKVCHPQTRICVAVDLTAPTERVQTKTAQGWKSAVPELHKRPAIFLLLAERG